MAKASVKLHIKEALMEVSSPGWSMSFWTKVGFSAWKEAMPNDRGEKRGLFAQVKTVKRRVQGKRSRDRPHFEHISIKSVPGATCNVEVFCEAV